ncbi:sodium-dependent transporter [Rhodobacteraceae bacterium RKSG542]|uniref:sodium-dependent transporter n=1 Tax=Pseudovibrio flavus TaxID=2529854 RepID=UPI0012BBFD14|nr:sodium-dependent transporter [Pseudovibrio flavus]MTI19385.1 sodium-dependent transporter [Pseudovibrio flavus]
MKRENWGSRFGFIMAAAGSAIGLGNIWKFPYLAGSEGGGAFLLVYLFFMVTIGFCIMAAEIAMGRRTQQSPVGAFLSLGGKGWVIFGYLATIAAFIILSYYSVVGGWTIAYFVKTLTGGLATTDAVTHGDNFGALISSPIEPIIYHGVFMALTILIVLKGVNSGIEKASEVLMPLLFALMIIMVIRAVTLPGAMEGIKFFLQPNWDQFDMGTVSAAMGQAFFSLSLGMGAIITYGSYVSKSDRIPGSAGYIVTLDTSIAFLAGMMILPAVFAFNVDPGAGPGLTFITLPAIFEQMWAGTFFQAAFFLMLAIAALTSAISLLNNPVSYLEDNHGMNRQTATIIVGVGIFLLGVPSSLAMGVWGDVSFFGKDFFSLCEFLTDKLLLPIGGIAVSVMAGWVAYPLIVEELTNKGTAQFAYLPVWSFVCRIFAPLAILYILVSGLLV